MRLIKNLPIQRKVQCLILITAGLSVLFADVALFLYQRHVVREHLERDLHALADLVAANCAGPVLFGDPESTQEVIAALAAKPEVIGAAVQLLDGKVLASVGRLPTGDLTSRSIPTATSWYQGSEFVVDRPIAVGKDLRGSLRLRADFRSMYAGRLRMFLWVLGIVAGGAVLAAGLISSSLQRALTLPIVQLAAVARRIAQEKDYSVRARPESRDEVGVFTDAFNQMLERIQRDDAALRAVNRDLEGEILERRRVERALRDSEERFRSLFENASVGLYRLGLDQGFTMANPVLLRLLGLDTLTRTDGRALREQLYVDPEVRDRVRALLQESGEVRGLESEWRGPNGTHLWVRESARAIRDAQGAVMYYEGTVEDITSRREAALELERVHRKLVETSRWAGMAEVATGVLHNVGNVLNSVNVSATLLDEGLRRSMVTTLVRVVDLLHEHREDLGRYLETDAKGRMVPEFLKQLSAHLVSENQNWQGEVQGLRKNIEHIKEIVAMQQSYARVAGLIEHLPAVHLVEDALQLNEADLLRDGVQVERLFEEVPPVAMDKHKVLQILVNLFRNARLALREAPIIPKRLTVRIGLNGAGRVRISVQDNGVGIAPEHLPRIFAHGFTTRKDGHGFGLHSGALAAKEMGGSLSAVSPGPGRGATFTLELPLAKPPKETSG